ITPLKIISENTYGEWSLKYGHLFDAGIGAVAIKKLLQGVKMDETVKLLEEEIKGTVGAKREKLVRRVKLLKSLAANGIKPEWMILSIIPVVPPDLRPMVALDGGRFATSDLNDLYRRVINRNNRLKRLIELNAPEVISRNERRMLQEAVDALIDNSARQTKTVVAATGKKRQLKSLADVLKGKQGRFRQNLLGKRIDYSGRSVIVVGPTLKIYQCGLPKRMALELFRPFIICQLIKRELVHNIRSANRFIESNRPEVWDILEDVTRDAYVLLNRAPTLHRLGIQAFQPVLIEGKAISIHPLVCTAFNADFDGDQMAVHVPLTEQAKEEAKNIMLSVKNLLKPATGAPIANPGKDIVWGVYYMTILTPRADGIIKAFAAPADAVLAYESGKVGLQEKVKIRMTLAKARGQEIVETSPGRILVNRIVPEKIPFINDLFTAKKCLEITKLCIEECGQERTAKFLDDIKEMGFAYITKSGFSWGMDDLPELGMKKAVLEAGDRAVEEIEGQFNDGLLTRQERYSKIIEVWMNIRDQVTKASREVLDRRGSVYSMIDSGSRGSMAQLTQMVGMKGPVGNPAGKIIEVPIKRSFKEGLDVLEYFIATHGSRKGSSDTALRTASAGYLTRRLVDVSQDVIIHSEDCGDTEGIVIGKNDLLEGSETLSSRIFGRYAMADIKVPGSKKIIVKAGELITEEKAREILKNKVSETHVHSILKCKLRRGLCRKCYGYDFAYNEPVKLGTAVGIIAAQSIGEPGTQLTMRTFHTGGVAGSDITQGLPRVEELFEARAPKRRAIIAEVGGSVEITEAERRTVVNEEGEEIQENAPGGKVIRIKYLANEEDEYKFAPDDEVKIKNGAAVAEGEVLFVKKSGFEVRAKRNGAAVTAGRMIKVEREAEQVREYLVPPGFALWIKDGDLVAAGDQLTEGDLDLHELYRLRGKEAVQKYLLREVKKIYASQGQPPNDKHIEIIIRQMFSRVYITESGDTDLLPGEIIERAEFEENNGALSARGGSASGGKKSNQPAEGQELFLGITKVSLSTQSFLSAASFQETARVLINAAVTGKVDRLEGLKENVIIGRLIPAGTGFGKKGGLMI
ncbi:MAG: DNA-directed RNA polymerase subunit beta', partial [Candidatus Margulisiibacteriota bacterium]